MEEVNLFVLQKNKTSSYFFKIQNIQSQKIKWHEYWASQYATQNKNFPSKEQNNNWIFFQEQEIKTEMFLVTKNWE